MITNNKIKMILHFSWRILKMNYLNSTGFGLASCIYIHIRTQTFHFMFFWITFLISIITIGCFTALALEITSISERYYFYLNQGLDYKQLIPIAILINLIIGIVIIYYNFEPMAQFVCNYGKLNCA